MGNGLASAAAAGGGVHQLIVGQDSAGGLGVHLAGRPNVQILLLLLHLQGSFLDDEILQLLGGDQRCVAAEERTGGGISAGIKSAGVRVARHHGNAIHGQL